MVLTIGFSSAKNDLMLFGRLIELIERRPFSHAFVIYKDPITNVDMVFQASHGIVHCCTLARHKENNNIILTYDLAFSQEQFIEFYNLMINSLGQSYAWHQILGIFIGKLFRCKNPFDNNLSTNFCSQLMVYVCLIKGIPIEDKPNSVTPSDLNEILSRYSSNNI